MGRRIAHQPPRALVPQAEAQALDAGEQGDRLDGLKERLGTVGCLEMIIGNARAQVVDMMEADVAGKPLENPGQLVIGIALERRILVPPAAAPRTKFGRVKCGRNLESIRHGPGGYFSLQTMRALSRS